MSDNPFDVLASEYDKEFTDSPIALYLRQRVQKRLLSQISAHHTALELGCGTGADALYLAENGCHVIATDASQEMLSIATQKTQHTQRVEVLTLNLNDLPNHCEPLNEVFDSVYSNFGVLNCVSNRGALAQWLAQRVRIGGRVALGIMAPTCLWEILWHGIHGEFNIATRRFKPSVFQPSPNSLPITIDYPSPMRLASEFAPYFSVCDVYPLGIALPPTALYKVLEKRPQILKTLLQWEKRLESVQLLARFADHYWIEFERRL